MTILTLLVKMSTMALKEAAIHIMGQPGHGLVLWLIREAMSPFAMIWWLTDQTDIYMCYGAIIQTGKCLLSANGMEHHGQVWAEPAYQIVRCITFKILSWIKIHSNYM